MKYYQLANHLELGLKKRHLLIIQVLLKQEQEKNIHQISRTINVTSEIYKMEETDNMIKKLKSEDKELKVL